MCGESGGSDGVGDSGDSGVGGDAGRTDVDNELDRAVTAAREAVGRARAAAAGRGLRPGRPGRADGARRPRVAGESRVSGAHPDDRDPQPFGRGIQRLVHERGWDLEVAVGGVMGRWTQVVGAQVAEHCVPEHFADSVLVVRADSTAWATQVRLLAPTLLRRLADELGEGVVAQVRVVGPAGPTWRKGSRSVPGRGPRDTYG